MRTQGNSAERLLADARQTPGEGLGPLLELYRRYLHALARSRLGTQLQARMNASDVVQETFLEAYRDFPHFRGTTEAELVRWLRQILLHKLGHVVEQQLKARKRDARRDEPLDAVAPPLSPGSSPSMQAQRHELSAVLTAQLGRLPPDYREVLVLRNLHELPFEEVARRMNRSSAAARALWLRALDHLRRVLKEENLL